MELNRGLEGENGTGRGLEGEWGTGRGLEGEGGPGRGLAGGWEGGHPGWEEQVTSVVLWLVYGLCWRGAGGQGTDLDGAQRGLEGEKGREVGG